MTKNYYVFFGSREMVFLIPIFFIFFGCNNQDDPYQQSSVESHYEVKGNVVEQPLSGARESWSSSSTHQYGDQGSSSVRATTDESHAWKAEVDYGSTKANMETDSDGRGWRGR